MVRRLIAFGFGDLGFHRIAADVAVENHACIRLLEKVGLQFEGVSRDCIRAQGRWWTEARYAILASDAEIVR
jgi:RimJ/RimL family protein N-acetyltransferase